MNRLNESSSSSALRSFIQEVLKVTITTQDINNEKLTYRHKIKDPDQALNLEWELSKLKLLPLSFVKTKEKEKAIERAENSQAIGSIAAQVVSNPQDVDHLVEVLLPWRVVGYEALDKLRLLKVRRGKTFPFFSYPRPRIGKSIPFDNIDPSMLDFLLNVNARIGSSVTGKGEFLLALLTGGISGGEEGDININGRQWEVKDARDGREVRLGDVTSTKFRSLLAGRSVESIPPVESSKLLKQSFGKIAGFVIVTPSGFEFKGKNDVKFSRFNKAGRVHVTF